MPFKQVFCWTDSSVVLYWIRTRPCDLKTYVSNRVATIQECTEGFKWNYVPTKCNPADIASRGTTLCALLENKLWWSGPLFLSEDSTQWPSLKSTKHDVECTTELRRPVREELVLVSTAVPSLDLVERFIMRSSSFEKTRRIFAYVLRFTKNCRSQNQKTIGPLKVVELNRAQWLLIKSAQAVSFSEEILSLKTGKSIKNNRLIAFSPFLDTDGVLRVGGRLKNSNFSFDKCHPALLSNKHYLSELIVQHEHIRLFHAGPQTLLASLRERFWILAARNLVKRIVYRCIICFKAAPRIINPIMGELPTSRITCSYPFWTTGVDYAGPILIKDRLTRTNKLVKVYIALFVCFSTKAVHLELVTELSTKCFLAAFRRFCSRRSKPNTVYSDLGRNFVGAKTQLLDLYKFLNQHKNEIIQTIASDGITWKFIPPRSPHMGGLWEANIKSCKYYLKRVSEGTRFTYEQYNTLLCEVEAILNSRPLAPLSNDPNDLSPITPAHFLVGRSLINIPSLETLVDGPTNQRDLFKLIEKLRLQFWKRWRKEYLSELQRRCKWSTKTSELVNGSMVIIKDDALPPQVWQLGRIIRTFPGKDGVSRVASVKVSTGEIVRSFAKLCPLPFNDSVIKFSAS